MQIRLKMGQAYYFVTELINTSDGLFGIWLTIKLLIMGMQKADIGQLSNWISYSNALGNVSLFVSD